MVFNSVITTLSAKDGGLVVFVHVPKTGGSSLVNVFETQSVEYEVNEIAMRGISYILEDKLFNKFLIPPSRKVKIGYKYYVKDRNKACFLHGHIDMSLAKFLPSKAQYMTILRNPVDRAVSHLYHFRRRGHEQIHDLACNSSLIEWVRNRNLVEMDNGQVRRLSGNMKLPIGGVTQKNLDCAKKSLEKFKFVGTTERLDDFFGFIQQDLGLINTVLPKVNIGFDRPPLVDFSSYQQDTIREFNRFDIELHKFANQLIDDKMIPMKKLKFL